MKKLLLAEDDQDIIKLLNLHLVKPEYEFTFCSLGEEAIKQALSKQFDLIILDITLPDKDGIEVCKTIRKNCIEVPVMMLSARTEEIDKVLAFEFGADDYMTKPFSIREFLARIKAHLRRSDQVPQIPAALQEEIRFKSLVIDKELRKASLKNKRLEFTPKEFDLLLLLANNPGKTFNRTELLKLVWGYSISGYEHTVTSHINRIRTKLETNLDVPQYILTSWGIGYRFSDEIQA
jgi:two-component system alkaline phosphatase synthesis response regulator PhoP